MTPATCVQGAHSGCGARAVHARGGCGAGSRGCALSCKAPPTANPRRRRDSRVGVAMRDRAWEYFLKLRESGILTCVVRALLESVAINRLGDFNWLSLVKYLYMSLAGDRCGTGRPAACVLQVPLWDPALLAHGASMQLRSAACGEIIRCPPAPLNRPPRRSPPAP